MASETLKSLDNVLSSKFDRHLQEWGSLIPNIPIDKFLYENIDTENFKEFMLNNKDRWKGLNLRDFCFTVVQERNNNCKNNKKDNRHKIDEHRVKELYETLVTYTNDRIKTFKYYEENKQKLGIGRDELITERNEILGFVRAREALKEKGVKIYGNEANEQKIRDAKVILKLTKKGNFPSQVV